MTKEIDALFLWQAYTNRNNFTPVGHNCKKLIPDLCVQGKNYVIDEGVEVIATPGHSGADVSLIVRNTTNGIILVAGNSANVLICMCV